MQTITLNIGLASSKGNISPGAAYALISGIIGKVRRSRLASSHTEETLVAEIETEKSVPELEEAIHTCAEILHQDCIAWIEPNGLGHLSGPRAHAWEPFNAHHFIGIINPEIPAFREYLRDTIIPDSITSGFEGYATDLQTALDFLNEI